jgi:cysteinyl-tRNA synthetase
MRMDPLELADKFEEAFFNDITELGIINADLYPRVSDHITEIIEVIQNLIQKDFGYEIDGDVYFDISKFPDYGKLSHQRPEELKKHRIEPDPRKRDPSDFSLWKSREQRELGWESPWVGEGQGGI